MAITAAAIIGGSSLLGGMMAKDAASESAAAQRDAARIAAESAKFKPYSITSGFGKSFFDTENNTAGYEIDPRLAAFRDQLYNQATQTLAQLGSTNPEAEAAKYVTQQMGLLQPTRAAEDVNNRLKALGSGRMGLGVSGGYVGGGEGLLNPDQFATQLARERANAEIAAAGTQYGQNIYDKMLSRGTGMLQTGLGIEELGMKPLTIGADIGNKAALSGANAGQLLLTGASNAANANLAGNLSMANMVTGAGRTAGGMLYNQPQPTWNSQWTPNYGQYTPGSETYVGPMPQ
jgi:hypothetical protein